MTVISLCIHPRHAVQVTLYTGMILFTRVAKIYGEKSTYIHLKIGPDRKRGERKREIRRIIVIALKGYFV